MMKVAIIISAVFGQLGNASERQSPASQGLIARVSG